MTNGERADRLVREARQIAGEMSRALDDEAWNLATRRAQEALELAIKALLNEIGVEYPKTHDPLQSSPRPIRARGIGVDEAVLDCADGTLEGARQDQGPGLRPFAPEEPVIFQTLEGQEPGCYTSTALPMTLRSRTNVRASAACASGSRWETCG